MLRTVLPIKGLVEILHIDIKCMPMEQMDLGVIGRRRRIFLMLVGSLDIQSQNGPVMGDVHL